MIRRLVVLALVFVAPRLHAQAKTQCSSTSERFSFDSTAAGKVSFWGGNVVIRCPERGITVKGDSAEQTPDHYFVIGHASYDEPRLHVTSDFLNYFPNDEDVRAVGHVDAKLPSGSRLVGPIAEYYLAGRIRKQTLMTARARPTITIVEKDSAGRPSEPTTVVSDSVRVENDSLVYARGEVVITRPNLDAQADSVFIDEGAETMALRRGPQLHGKGSRPFTLTGDLIDLFSRNRKLERVISKTNAVALSDSMTLKADTIDLRIRNDVLDHAFAWGKAGRAHVNSPSQNLVADSLDVEMPAQRIRTVRAFNRAYAEGKPDTTRFKPDKSQPVNWLRGDTITAHFDTTPPPPRDTSKSPQIKNLVASGNASSVYLMPPSDSAEHRPAINYVVARIIAVDFSNQQVATVTTVDSVSGVFLEPKPDTAKKQNAAATAPRTINQPTNGAKPAVPPTRPGTPPPKKPPAADTPLATPPRTGKP